MLEETHDCSLESSVTGRNAGEVVAVETVHRVHKVCIILTMLHFPRKTVPLESKCCVLKVYFFPDSLTPKLSEIDFKLKTPMCLFLTTVCLAEKWYIRIHINLDSPAPGKQTIYVTHWQKRGLYSVPLGMFYLSGLKICDYSSCACSHSVSLWRQWHLQLSAVWNTAFAIAFNDYLRLLKKTKRRPWHGDGVEGLAETNCYLHVVIKLENTLKNNQGSHLLDLSHTNSFPLISLPSWYKTT